MPYWINLIVGIVSAVVSAGFGAILIPYLKKLKAGAHILEIGPRWQKDKEGTPLMGGFMFAASTVIASLAGCVLISRYRSAHMLEQPDNAVLKLLLGLGVSVCFLLIGFADDYIKVVKKRNQGFNVKAKSVCQVIVVVLYLAGLHLLGDTTKVVIPFLGEVDFGIFYYIIMAVAIYGFVNAVNLTDGVDGLCGSVTLIYAAAFAFIFVLLGDWEYSAFATAVAGGCLGFLVWNLHPAKVFMGDTGSMFLGGCVVALGFASGLELLIPLVGIIYFIEAMSDVIQIGSYKLRHKRVFKMAPIHHHFELSGWSEYKIVFVFSAITLAAGILGVAATVIYLK